MIVPGIMIAIAVRRVSKQFGLNLVDGCMWKEMEDVNLSTAATAAAATTNQVAVPSIAACCSKHHVVNSVRITRRRQTSVSEWSKEWRPMAAYLWNWVAHGSDSKCECLRWQMSVMANGSNGEWQQWRTAAMANGGNVEWQWRWIAAVISGNSGKVSSGEWQQLQLSSTQWQFRYGGRWWHHYHLLWKLAELSWWPMAAAAAATSERHFQVWWQLLQVPRCCCQWRPHQWMDDGSLMKVSEQLSEAGAKFFTGHFYCWMRYVEGTFYQNRIVKNV